MIIFYAGAEANVYNDILLKNGRKNRLISYYAVKGKGNQELLNIFKNFDRIFLDSGGFSARVKGVEINVSEYGDFINRYKKNLFCYANLDQRHTEDTLNNQKVLEELGLNPIPVFHRDEWEDGKLSLLDDYLRNYDYVALGGVAGSNKGESYIRAYLDSCFSVIKNYFPKKIHGFGMTATWILKRYPFYSVDSTDWLSSARWGAVARFESGKMRSNNTEYNRIYSKVVDYKDRTNNMVIEYAKLESYINGLWKSRGITWKD